MKTEVVFARTSNERAKAITLLRAGEVVALPTETVYGLAADALNAEAVAKIFEAKERHICRIAIGSKRLSIFRRKIDQSF